MAARRERWARIVEQAQASGMPVRQYCQKHDVDEGQFYHWRRLLESEAACSKTKTDIEPGFVLVRAGPAAKSVAPDGPETCALELVLERGWRLRIPSPVDEAALRAVLSVLSKSA